jgi:Holliday junction resolvase RusA-like endonuclease
VTPPALICAFHVAGGVVPWARSRTRNGHHFTAPKVASYQGAIRAAAYDSMEGRPPFDGACRVRINAHFPIPASWSKKKRAAAAHHASKPDADNILKQMDALNGIVFTDDSRLADVRVVKLYAETPGLFVEVWALAPDLLTMPDAPLPIGSNSSPRRP